MSMAGRFILQPERILFKGIYRKNFVNYQDLFWKCKFKTTVRLCENQELRIQRHESKAIGIRLLIESHNYLSAFEALRSSLQKLEWGVLDRLSEKEYKLLFEGLASEYHKKPRKYFSFLELVFSKGIEVSAKSWVSVLKILTIEGKDEWIRKLLRRYPKYGIPAHEAEELVQIAIEVNSPILILDFINFSNFSMNDSMSSKSRFSKIPFELFESVRKHLKKEFNDTLELGIKASIFFLNRVSVKSAQYYTIKSFVVNVIKDYYTSSHQGSIPNEKINDCVRRILLREFGIAESSNTEQIKQLETFILDLPGKVKPKTASKKVDRFNTAQCAFIYSCTIAEESLVLASYDAFRKMIARMPDDYLIFTFSLLLNVCTSKKIQEKISDMKFVKESNNTEVIYAALSCAMAHEASDLVNDLLEKIKILWDDYSLKRQQSIISLAVCSGFGPCLKDIISNTEYIGSGLSTKVLFEILGYNFLHSESEVIKIVIDKILSRCDIDKKDLDDFINSSFHTENQEKVDLVLSKVFKRYPGYMQDQGLDLLKRIYQFAYLRDLELACNILTHFSKGEGEIQEYVVKEFMNLVGTYETSNAENVKLLTELYKALVSNIDHIELYKVSKRLVKANMLHNLADGAACILEASTKGVGDSSKFTHILKTFQYLAATVIKGDKWDDIIRILWMSHRVPGFLFLNIIGPVNILDLIVDKITHQMKVDFPSKKTVSYEMFNAVQNVMNVIREVKISYNINILEEKLNEIENILLEYSNRTQVSNRESRLGDDFDSKFAEIVESNPQLECTPRFLSLASEITDVLLESSLESDSIQKIKNLDRRVLEIVLVYLVKTCNSDNLRNFIYVLEKINFEDCKFLSHHIVPVVEALIESRDYITTKNIILKLVSEDACVYEPLPIFINACLRGYRHYHIEGILKKYPFEKYRDKIELLEPIMIYHLTVNNFKDAGMILSKIIYLATENADGSPRHMKFAYILYAIRMGLFNDRIDFLMHMFQYLKNIIHDLSISECNELLRTLITARRYKHAYIFTIIMARSQIIVDEIIFVHIINKLLEYRDVISAWKMWNMIMVNSVNSKAISAETFKKTLFSIYVSAKKENNKLCESIASDIEALNTKKDYRFSCDVNWEMRVISNLHDSFMKKYADIFPESFSVKKQHAPKPAEIPEKYVIDYTNLLGSNGFERKEFKITNEEDKLAKDSETDLDQGENFIENVTKRIHKYVEAPPRERISSILNQVAISFHLKDNVRAMNIAKIFNTVDAGSIRKFICEIVLKGDSVMLGEVLSATRYMESKVLYYTLSTLCDRLGRKKRVNLVLDVIRGYADLGLRVPLSLVKSFIDTRLRLGDLSRETVTSLLNAGLKETEELLYFVSVYTAHNNINRLVRGDMEGRVLNLKSPTYKSLEILLILDKKSTDSEKAKLHWESMISSGVCPTLECYNILIRIFNECNKPEDAHSVLLNLLEKNIISRSEYNQDHLLAFMNSKKITQAVDFAVSICEEWDSCAKFYPLPLSPGVLFNLLELCSESKDARRAELVKSILYSFGILKDALKPYACSSVHKYLDRGELEYADTVYTIIGPSAIAVWELDVHTRLLLEYASAGYLEKMETVYLHIKRREVLKALSPSVFEDLIGVMCSQRTLKSLQFSRRFFNDMTKELGLMPRRKVLEDLILAHAECNDPESAEMYLCAAQQAGFEPSRKIYANVMASWANTSLKDRIIRMAYMMIPLGIGLNSKAAAALVWTFLQKRNEKDCLKLLKELKKNDYIFDTNKLLNELVREAIGCSRFEDVYRVWKSLVKPSANPVILDPEFLCSNVDRRIIGSGSFIYANTPDLPSYLSPRMANKQYIWSLTGSDTAGETGTLIPNEMISKSKALVEREVLSSVEGKSTKYKRVSWNRLKPEGFTRAIKN